MKATRMAELFDVQGRLVGVTPAGSGNVNDTYVAVFRTTFSEERFIVQKLNLNVFPSPDAVMQNMRVVTEHVHERLEAEADEADRIWQLPRIIPTKCGQDYFINDDNECWRAISLIESATAYEKVESPEHANEVGTVMGQFQRLISDIDIDALEDTLPGYHITPRYLTEYDRVLATEDGQRRLAAASIAKYCQRFVEERRSFATVLEDALARGELSQRPVHGDPKISNVMIDDDTGKGTCIIDLDTVKPGLIHYDFGDCLRSSCNMAGEEPKSLDQVRFDTDLCAAIVRGYMNYAKEFLTENDHKYLYDSVRLITFELGLRFFADYLNGDKYFKTKYDGQNLNRAQVQFKLCESIEIREQSIREILERY